MVNGIKHLYQLGVGKIFSYVAQKSFVGEGHYVYDYLKYSFVNSLKPYETPSESHDITLSTKVRLVKAMVFPLVMYGCESWTIKKAEGQRTDALELWCWRRLLRISWIARRSNQSILKEINPEY